MRPRIRTAGTLFAAVVACAAVIPASASAQGRRYAIIVGINRYDDPSSFGNLETCVADSNAMYDTLTKHCGYAADDVLLINDWGGEREEPTGLSLDEFNQLKTRMPTSENLRQRIPRWLALAQPEDTVLVFFSGHGILFEGSGILATSDCRLATADQSGLPTSELQGMLQNCAAERKVLVLDCCHAGAAADKSGGRNTSSEELATIFQRAQGLVTLASCGQNEKSQQDPKKGLSLFTYYLTLGLKGEADIDDAGEEGFGVVDHVELHSYVSHQVQKAMAQVFNNVEQTPKLFDEDSRGLFALARVRRSVNTDSYNNFDRGSLTGSGLANNTPPPPGAAATEAYERLVSEQSKRRKEDIELLITEADKLRQPLLKSAVAPPPSTRNPFVNDDRVNVAFDWLTEARKEREQGGIDLDGSMELSLKTSLALAAYFRPAAEIGLARELVEELYPFDQSSEMRGVRAQLFLVHAQTRNTTPEGQQQALDSYARIIELARQHERATGDAMSPIQLREDVINQGLAIASDVGQPSNASVRKRLAMMYGVFGELVDRNPVMFSRDKDLAKQHLQRAMELDPAAAEYPRSLASVLMQLPKPDYAQVRSFAETALSNSTDALNRLISQRLIGQAWLDGSRTMTNTEQRKQNIDQAVASFTRVVDNYDREFANRENVPNLASTHYVDSLVQRADAFKDQANFLLDFRGTGRRDALEKAIADARRATTIDDVRLQHRAWKALGNALEDSAWLAGQTENYAHAAEAFRTAAQKNQLSAQAHVDLARCLIKWETEGGHPGHLDEAKAELDYVVNNMFETLPKAHAHYWLAKINMHLGTDLDAAEEALKEAWDGMRNDPDINEYNLSVCIETTAKLALLRADGVLAQPGTPAADELAFVESQLGNASFSADELSKYDRPKAVGIHAQTHTKMAQLRKLQNQPERATAELQKAADKFARTLEAPELSDRQRAQVLLERCALYMTSDLKTEDIQKENPQSLQDALRAAELAAGEAEYAQAKGWAGLIRLENCQARRISYNDLENNPIYTTGIGELEEAIRVAPKHKSAGRWCLTAGDILYIKAAVIRSSGQPIPQEVSRRADSLYDQAAESDSSLKDLVDLAKRRLRSVDPRLNG